MKRLFLVLPILLLAGCTRMDPTLATRVLQDAGHTNIVLGESAPIVCVGENTYSVEFQSIGPTGRFVHGALCQRLGGSGVTIRYQ
ncbi:hypothetical protein D3C86_1181400 [compost metagenome]